MTRTIKASEVVPGQRVRWAENGTIRELTVESVAAAGCTELSVQIRNDAGFYEYVSPDTVVTVAVEAPVSQPEEPMLFGARVVVNRYKATRTASETDSISGRPWSVEYRDINGHTVRTNVTWQWLTEQGEVKVVPDPGWGEDEPENTARQWDRWLDVPNEVVVRPLHENWQARHTINGCDQVRYRNSSPWGTAPFWITDQMGPFVEVVEDTATEEDQ